MANWGTGVVIRTQVYLGEDELELLDRAGRETGASRSELTRCAVRSAYREKRVEAKLHSLQASAGSWKCQDITGAEYVDVIRGDLHERLRRL